MCSCDVGEYPEFYVVPEWREGRVEHTCEECFQKIPVGELHRYGSGRMEGLWFEWRLCARCDALHRAHEKAQETFGEMHCRAPLGMLRESMEECRGENDGYDAAFRAALVSFGAPADAGLPEPKRRRARRESAS